MMERTKTTFVLSIILLILAPADGLLATEVSGDVWGTWSLSGSPFYLVGDAQIPPGLTLIIEPGVEVIGMGNYKLTVESDAVLTAVGTESQPILFTADDPVTGWRGLRLESASDETEIRYTILEYARGTGAYPDVRGGALMIKNCSPVVSYSEFRFSSSKNSNLNGTGGGICTENSEAQILHNFVHDNEADSGGGICITEYGTPVVARNTIENNTANNGGGGMYLGARSMPLIVNNVIRDNHSSGWGGGGINCWNSYIFYNTFPTIENNIIVYNSTNSAGGGLYCRYDRAVLTNNVVVENSASRGGGIHVLNQEYSAPLVTNCIVWGNTAPTGPQIDLEGSTGSVVIVNYCDVEGGWGSGTGNIDSEPNFRTFGGFEYMLHPLSPCVDMGDPSIEDFLYDWHPRWPDWYPDGPRSDMGAYGGPRNVDWLH
jgi:parallel beta-helix repeat protein